jgi:tRNA pseudouridine38-40 synthase
MNGIRLIVAYDGADFSGWQVQPEQRTVQGELERAVAAMGGHHAKVRGAGRTDAGVHAEGQVAAFDAERTIPPEGWMLGLNRELPEDVAVRGAEACAVGYDPRFDAVDKTYRYLVHMGRTRDPLVRRRAWFVRAPLDVAAMSSAAAGLVGTHDYRVFRAADDERENTVRTIHAIDVTAGFAGHAELVAIEVRGSAFLKQMVRIIAGTLVDAGRGRLSKDAVAALVGTDAAREQAGPTAPAHGLTMVRVALGREPSSGPDGGR